MSPLPPRGLVFAAAILVALSLLPLAIIGVMRTTPSKKPRIHIIQDMDNQPAFKTQSETTLFADGRASRTAPEGTVPRGEPVGEDVLVSGRRGEEFAAEFPAEIEIDEDFIRRGRGRYNIYCAPCHGLSGYGDGLVSRRALELAEGTWAPPSNLHDGPIRGRAVGDIYNTIKNGVRNMPAYGAQISVEDRWAITAYVRALQLSQGVRAEELPAELRQGLQ